MSGSTITSLAGHREIVDHVSRFGRFLDGGPGTPADFYAADAEVVSPRARLKGLDAITEFLGRARSERTQHVHSDLLVESIDDRHATVSANQLVHFFEPRQAPHLRSGLRVTYDLVRTQDGWRFARVEMSMLWLIGELPPVPTGDAATSPV